MTEEEHIKLVEVGNMFYDNFSRLIANCVKHMPEHLRAETLDYLSDQASVFGSDYSKYLDETAEEN